MEFDSSNKCEKTGHVDVPPAYVGLRILLVDHDTTSLSNIAAILEEHSYKVTAIEQATVALSILRQQIDQFDLVMVDVNMSEIDYLEFIKSTLLIKDKPIVLMSPEVKTEMVKEAIAQGAFFIIRKSLVTSMKLKNVWRHVHSHNKKANKKSQHNKANQVDVMDNTSCAKRMRTTSEETQVKSSGTSEKEEDHSLISETSIERPQKKRGCVQWTPDLDKKLDEVVRELGEKARPREVLKRMCVRDLSMKHLTYRLKKYRSQKQQAPNVQPATLMNFNEGHHFSVLNSSDFSTNFNELFQGTYKPQPPVPLIASPSSNEYSLNGWNEWDELIESDNFDVEIMPENQSVTSCNWPDYVPIFGSPTQDNTCLHK